MKRYDRPGRAPAEIDHEFAHGPLDRADWPRVGDTVIYLHPVTQDWIPAVVLAVAEHDGDLKLDVGEGEGMEAVDSKHGAGPHCWLLPAEAAALSTPEATT